MFVAGAIGIFMLWALFVPIAGGVVASGRIVATGQNQVLQHPTGGVVQHILKRDGAEVMTGDLIAVIDPAPAVAELSRLKSRRGSLMARKARLEALKVGATSLRGGQGEVGSLGGLRGTQSDADKLVQQEQLRELEASVARVTSQRASLVEGLETLQGDLESNKRQSANAKNSLSILDQQLAKIKPLAKDGFVAQNQVWDIENSRLDIASRVDQLEGVVASLSNQIEAARSDLAAFDAEQDQVESRELSEVLEELASIDQLVAAAEGEVSYSELRAPVDGSLTKMAIFTEGGVVRGGDIIGEVVPKDVGLEAEVRLPTTDIKRVEVGADAKVTVMSFDQAQRQPLEGKVSYLAADSETDDQTGETYFTARVQLNPSSEDRARLNAGMLADAVIGNQSRSFFGYVLEPVLKSFRSAFREG